MSNRVDKLVRELKAVDPVQKQAPVPTDVDRRMESEFKTLARGASPARRWLTAVTVAAACSLVAVLWFRYDAPAASPSGTEKSVLADSQNPAIEGTQPEPECFVPDGSGRSPLPEGCGRSFEHRSLKIHGLSTSRFEERNEELWFHSGYARVEVKKLPVGGPPLRVHTAGGVIEVLGTVFLLEQAKGKGRVQLLEGRIRFTSNGGQAQELLPGQELAWRVPSKSVAGKTVADRGRTVRRQKLAPKQSGTVQDPCALLSARILRATQLRAAGDAKGALKLLRSGPASSCGAYTSEVLSYEIGDLMSLVSELRMPDVSIGQHIRITFPAVVLMPPFERQWRGYYVKIPPRGNFKQRAV